ncbi:hypothetical protein [Nonomuraea candida]|uniref:hypothetical protein n=1 Tax=Nonomuraea candida TaxID=359159 RepID=UPI0005BCB1D1|nr:hypothetical protein [Nonomuraea candida]
MIDTNVLIVANGKAHHVGSACVESAIALLEHTESRGIVVLDSSWLIFEEYERYCSFKGQPGVGDRFFLHLHHRQADRRHVHRVDITPDGRGSFEEVPEGLRAFDPSDHKFVATVVADGRQAVVVNCADSDWREAEQELKQNGITVVELCGDCRASRDR